MGISDLRARRLGSKTVNLEFLLLVSIAFVLGFIPFISVPFTWTMTFFHEISHGIAALLTGGSIENIELHLRGSGLCYTQGGVSFIVSLSGYIGAVWWGILIYEMADDISHKNTNILAGFLAGVVAFCALFYGRDLITWIVLIVLFSLFVSIIRLQEAALMKLSLKFTGVYVLLDAVRAPLHLIDGRHIGDGAKLADLTFIPEIFWVLLWLFVGLGGLLSLWKVNKKIL